MEKGLPPGQRARNDFPRFGVPGYANRVSQVPTDLELRLLREDGTHCASIGFEELRTLTRKHLTADFHCVATWTRRGVSWSGYGFRDVYETLIVPRVRPQRACAHLEFKALDGYTACILLEDLVTDGVLLADQLEGEPIPVEHGAPLRLIVPHLYAFKSVKHLHSIRPTTEHRRSFAERRTFAHPRGRVALEERGRGLPGVFFRYLYRALLPLTLWYYRRVQKKRAARPRAPA